MRFPMGVRKARIVSEGRRNWGQETQPKAESRPFFCWGTVCFGFSVYGAIYGCIATRTAVSRLKAALASARPRPRLGATIDRGILRLGATQLLGCRVLNCRGLRRLSRRRLGPLGPCHTLTRSLTRLCAFLRRRRQLSAVVQMHRALRLFGRPRTPRRTRTRTYTALYGTEASKLRGEVGARVLRVRSVSREEVWASVGVQGAWMGGCGCEAD